MIDWTKPIETVDGRKALRLAKGVDEAWHCVFVGPGAASSFALPDVFLVDNGGFRCDDRAIYSKGQEPFIRNVKVKKEGWVLMRPPVGTPINLSALLATNHVYPSEEEARKAMDCYFVEPGTKPVHLKWEE
jgi:hypothetical protein